MKYTVPLQMLLIAAALGFLVYLAMNPKSPSVAPTEVVVDTGDGQVTLRGPGDVPPQQGANNEEGEGTIEIDDPSEVDEDAEREAEELRQQMEEARRINRQRQAEQREQLPPDARQDTNNFPNQETRYQGNSENRRPNETNYQ